MWGLWLWRKECCETIQSKELLFSHQLSQNTRNLFYGIIDVQNRFVRFIGQPNQGGWASRPDLENAENMFSLQDYLDCVLKAQEQAFAFWLQNGAELISFEWIGTLTESRVQWNAEHPDLPIPLDF